MNDHRLRHDVLDELEFEPRVNSTHIGVGANAGVITLTGFMLSYGEKLAAEVPRWLEEAVPVHEEYAKGSPQPVMQAIEEARSRKIADDLDAFLAGRFGKRLAEPIKAIHEIEEGLPTGPCGMRPSPRSPTPVRSRTPTSGLEIERAAGGLLKLVARPKADPCTAARCAGIGVGGSPSDGNP